MGGSRRAWVGVSLALLLAFSGCTSSSSGAKALPTEAPAMGGVRGVVYNDASLPLEGVRVSLLESDFFADTGPDGAFEFRNVSVGAYVARAEATGFQFGEKAVNVTSENVTELLFYLVPSASTGAGYRPHQHDLWGGREEVTIMDSSVPVTSPDAQGGIGGPAGYRVFSTLYWPNANQTEAENNYRIPIPSSPEQPSIIYPGTKAIEVKLAWTANDATLHKVGLRYRTPIAPSATSMARQVSGSTWTIPVQPEETDTGHQTFTLWTFWINPYQDPAQDGANYRPGLTLGNFHVEIKILRGDVILEPAHEVFWGDKTELLLHDHGENIEPCNSGYRIIERDTNPCRKSPKRIVPPGTSKLQVELKWTYAQLDQTASSDMTLLYRTAAQHRWQTRTSAYNIATCSSPAAQTRLCEVPVKAGETDAFYQRFSLWAFTYAVKGQERNEFDAEPRPLTFTLKVVAHRDPGFQEV